MRAVSFATATVVRRTGLRSRSDLTHAPVLVSLAATLRMTEVALTMSSCRRVPLPILEMRPSRSLPLEEFCRGTSPRSAATYRPEWNTEASGTLAASAVAAMSPTPGMVFSRWLSAFERCQARSGCRGRE